MKLIELAITIIVAYRPPSYKEQENDKPHHLLLNVCADSEVLILRNFNFL